MFRKQDWHQSLLQKKNKLSRAGMPLYSKVDNNTYIKNNEELLLTTLQKEIISEDGLNLQFFPANNTGALLNLDGETGKLSDEWQSKLKAFKIYGKDLGIHVTITAKRESDFLLYNVKGVKKLHN